MSCTSRYTSAWPNCSTTLSAEGEATLALAMRVAYTAAVEQLTREAAQQPRSCRPPHAECLTAVA